MDPKRGCRQSNRSKDETIERRTHFLTGTTPPLEGPRGTLAVEKHTMLALECYAHASIMRSRATQHLSVVNAVGKNTIAPRHSGIASREQGLSSSYKCQICSLGVFCPTKASRGMCRDYTVAPT